MNTDKYTWRLMLLEVLMVLLGLIVMFPVLFVVGNSVKSLQEVTLSMLSLPSEVHFSNFGIVLERMNYFVSLGNSVMISSLAVSGIVLFSSLAAYQIVRRKSFSTKALMYMLLLSMAIPFQALMVPLVIVARELKLMNKPLGMVPVYWGFLLPMSTFLYQAYIKSVPREVEEAAIIDGCAPIPLFFLIVFPVIKPITVSVIILNFLAVFNDFTLPLIMLTSRDTRTIPLSLSTFFGSYLTEWHLVMASLTITIVPLLALFLFLQKHIIKGMADGALKG